MHFYVHTCMNISKFLFSFYIQQNLENFVFRSAQRTPEVKSPISKLVGEMAEHKQKRKKKKKRKLKENGQIHLLIYVCLFSGKGHIKILSYLVVIGRAILTIVTNL